MTIGKRSTETDAAKWARRADQQPLINPAQAEADREHAVEKAVANVVGPDKARELVDSLPPAHEPALTAYEASMLRRAVARIREPQR